MTEISDDGETLKPAKKKIRVSEFILDEAEVFDDDDEASDDDEDKSDVIANEKVEEEGPTAREGDGQRRLEGANKLIRALTASRGQIFEA